MSVTSGAVFGKPPFSKVTASSPDAAISRFNRPSNKSALNHGLNQMVVFHDLITGNSSTPNS